MASVILPTTTWTNACDDLATQLTPTDELLVVCDSPTDEVTNHREQAGVHVIVAGDPEGCSGKCNAIAAGLEAATDEVIICTDGDFEHEPGWLDHVKADIDEHGAVSTIPFFQIQSPLGYLLDAPVLLFGTSIFTTKTAMWGGLIGFKRTDVDLDALTHDLRRTVTDDLLIAEYIDDRTLDPALAAPVTVDGSLESVRNRSIRFMRSTLYFTPQAFLAVFFSYAILLAGTLLAPLATAVGVTATAALTYYALGFRRWTFILAYPGFLVSILMTLYGLSKTEFEWHGRHYQWTGKFQVDILKP